MSYRTIEEALTLGLGIERSFVCHVHADTNASASVNAVTGLWICYACGAAGRVDPEKVVISPNTVVRAVNQALAIIEGGGHQTYPESWLSLFDGAGPGEYWLSRFSPAACRHHRLGWDPHAQAPVYPLRDPSGRVLGMVQRTGDPHQKYKYPPGSNTSSLLYGYHEAQGDEIYLVEGATDAIALQEIGLTAMAVYGSRLSWAQANMLDKYAPKRIWMASDQDREGNRLAEDVAYAFPSVDVRRLCWTGVKDVASIPLEDRTDVLAEARTGEVASATCGSEPDDPRLSQGSSRQRRLRITLSVS